MSKLEELKRVKAAKAALLAQQRALVNELNATKEQRKGQRAARKNARVTANESGKSLRTLVASVRRSFRDCTPGELDALSHKIDSAASDLVGAIQSFADASRDPVVEAEADDDFAIEV